MLQETALPQKLVCISKRIQGILTSVDKLPPTAQVAEQEGKYVARVLNAKANGKDYGPFKYQNRGMLACILETRLYWRYYRNYSVATKT
jgi:hypothetical protein